MDAGYIWFKCILLSNCDNLRERSSNDFRKAGTNKSDASDCERPCAAVSRFLSRSISVDCAISLLFLSLTALEILSDIWSYPIRKARMKIEVLTGTLKFSGY